MGAVAVSVVTVTFVPQVAYTTPCSGIVPWNLKIVPWNPKPETIMSNKSAANVKQLRAIGHKLKPIVTIAGNGLSENVLTELHRALKDHELIKIKLAVGSREVRAETIDQICEQTGATLVQGIGNTALLLLRSKKPDPKLSNLVKPLTDNR